MRSLGKTFARLLRNEQGTAIVELALIAPVLAVLTVGIVDLSNGVTRRMLISEAVHRTLEKAAANNFEIQSNEEDTSYDFLRDEAAAAAGNGVTRDNVAVTVWLECDGVETDFEETCAAGETTARYLQLKIDSSYRPSFTWVVMPSADGTVPLSAEAAVRIQ